MATASTKTTTSSKHEEENSVLSKEDMIFIKNCFKNNSKPSNDQMGLYFVSGMLLPSQRERCERVMTHLLEEEIQVNGFFVTQSEFNGKIFAKKVCEV